MVETYDITPEQLKALLRRATKSDLIRWKDSAKRYDPEARYVINNVGLRVMEYAENPLPPSLVEFYGLD